MVYLGVNLTPIIVKKQLKLAALRGRTIAVDAFNVLHQFLALIRTDRGKLLTDNSGRVTSHLVGLSFRVTRLISDYGIRPIFVFDGEPSNLKMEEIKRRRKLRKKAEAEYAEALEKEDYVTAFSKAVRTGRLETYMVEDSKRLLDILGVPWIQAPAEGEAQAAHITNRGDAWATGSRDYDSLLFGASRLVRYITIQGVEWLPSVKKPRKLEPELIDLSNFLGCHGINREQLVDLAILVGTDFNPGIKGVGPKTALRLLKRYNRIEELPEKILGGLTENYMLIRRIFLDPEVTEDYSLNQTPLKENELHYFLCCERAFSRKRVELLVERMRKAQTHRSIMEWTNGDP